jgi:hypothetical protein
MGKVAAELRGGESPKAASGTGATQRKGLGGGRSQKDSLVGVQRRGRMQRNGTPKETFREGMKGRRGTEEESVGRGKEERSKWRHGDVKFKFQVPCTP